MQYDPYFDYDNVFDSDALKKQKKGKDNMISFITGIRYEKDTLKQLNSMTFLFDPNWNNESSVKSTLPICCFGITRMDEISSTEVSTKQLLFFNDSSAPNNARQTSGLLNVVADNIVLKPRQWKLNVVIPANDLFFRIGSHNFNPQLSNTVSRLILNGDDEQGSNATGILSFVTMDTPILREIKALIKDLTFNMNYDIDSWLTSVTETPMFNKNSLDAMRDNRSILKFKSWDSWNYKYVSIVDMDISKEPTDDGVFTGSITLQEMPIMQVANRIGTKKDALFVNKFKDKTLNLIKDFVNNAEGSTGE